MADEATQTDTPAEESKPEEVKEEKKEAVKEEKAEEPAKEPVEVPAKFKSIVEEVEKMSVLDLSELVKVLEDRFGVSAAAPVAVLGGGAAGGDAGAEEKSEFAIELADVGSNKIAVIKAVREITALGLKEAKDMVDAAPKVIKENVGKADAEAAKQKIEEAGGKVNLK